MSTDTQMTQAPTTGMSAPEFFAREVQTSARRQLTKLMGTEDGQKAAQAITMAFLSAASSARSITPYADAARDRPDTIANCIALSAQTKLYPGGPNPDVYLVPQSGELQWRITHRGVAKLMARAGFHVLAVPVHREDTVRVSMGELVEHEQDPSRSVQSLDALMGVAVVVRRTGDGAVLARPWVPFDIIDARRRASRMSGKGPWKDWPIEMAQKTAILYCAARGAIPAESADVDRVVSAEYEHTTVTPVDAPALVDGGAE